MIVHVPSQPPCRLPCDTGTKAYYPTLHGELLIPYSYTVQSPRGASTGLVRWLAANFS